MEFIHLSCGYEVYALGFSFMESIRMDDGDDRVHTRISIMDSKILDFCIWHSPKDSAKLANFCISLLEELGIGKSGSICYWAERSLRCFAEFIHMGHGVHHSYLIRRIHREKSADKIKHSDTVNTKAINSQQCHTPRSLRM